MVRRFGFQPVPALTAKIGVPVNPKIMIVLEILFHLDCLFALFDLPSDNSGAHVSKLAAVALVKHKQKLFDIWQVSSKLGSFKGSQGLTASCGMPDISSGFDSAFFLVVGGHFNPVQNTLGCHNLIRSHNEQRFLRSEHAIFCQDVQNNVLRKECLCEVHKVGNDLVIAVCPIGSELKTVRSFLAVLLGRIFTFLNVTCSGSVRIVLCKCAVGDYKNLNTLIKSTTSPKAITLIVVNLIECFLDCHSTAF